MKFSFLIQARLGSTRTPGKTLTPIKGGDTLLEFVYKRVLKAKEATKENIYVLTSESVKDDPLAAFLKEHNILFARGSEQNVYKRFYDFLLSDKSEADYVIRVCADNPFLEPKFIDELTDFLKNSKDPLPGYLSHMDASGRLSMGTQYGFFCEAISRHAFMRANEMDLTDMEKEHVTPQFYKSGIFSTSFIPMPLEIQDKAYRFTIDTPTDLDIVRRIAEELPENFSYMDVIIIAQKYPEIMDFMAMAVSGDKKVGR